MNNVIIGCEAFASVLFLFHFKFQISLILPILLKVSHFHLFLTKKHNSTNSFLNTLKYSFQTTQKNIKN